MPVMYLLKLSRCTYLGCRYNHLLVQPFQQLGLEVLCECARALQERGCVDLALTSPPDNIGGGLAQLLLLRFEDGLR
eukprot:2948684-Pyramimonas_sp.AAC.1